MYVYCYIHSFIFTSILKCGKVQKLPDAFIYLFFYQHELQRTSPQFISSNISCTSCCKQLICRQSGTFLSNMILMWKCV